MASVVDDPHGTWVVQQTLEIQGYWLTGPTAWLMHPVLKIPVKYNALEIKIPSYIISNFIYLIIYLQIFRDVMFLSLEMKEKAGNYNTWNEQQTTMNVYKKSDVQKFFDINNYYKRRISKTN